MRRAAVTLAMVLALGLVGGAAQAKKQRLKVETRVAIDGFDYALDTDTVTLFGHLRGKKPTCLRHRTVRLQQITEDVPAGFDRSDDSGYWEIDFIGVEVPPGRFRASVRKRKVVKKRKIIRCRRDVSPAFVAVPGEG
jgi:hypothetical protein